MSTNILVHRLNDGDYGHYYRFFTTKGTKRDLVMEWGNVVKCCKCGSAEELYGNAKRRIYKL